MQATALVGGHGLMQEPFQTMIYNSVDDDIYGQPSLILYPNPAGDYLNINSDNINFNKFNSYNS